MTAKKRTQSNGGRPRPTAKISAEFARRLHRLRPDQMVHAIVLLHAPESQSLARGQGLQDHAERGATIRRVQSGARRALPIIDRILENVGGARLRCAANALGSIAVESTANGIFQLADSEQVQAILEDQAVSLRH